MTHLWPRTDDLAQSLDLLRQATAALRCCYLRDPNCDADDFATRQADYDTALTNTLEIILNRVQNQAAITIVSMALAPHGAETTGHLNAVIDRVVEALAPRVVELLVSTPDLLAAVAEQLESRTQARGG